MPYQLDREEKCGFCGHEMKKGEIVRDAPGYGQICSDCYDEDFKKCADCGDIVRKTQIRTVTDDDKSVCVNCYNDYKRCNECDILFNIDDMHRIDSRTIICNDCYNNEFNECFSCGNSFHINDLTFIEGAERSYCDSCLDRSPWRRCDECHEWFNYEEEGSTGDNGYRCEDCTEHPACVECGNETDEPDLNYAGFCEDCEEAITHDVDSIKAVHEQFPLLKERMRNVFLSSIEKREEDSGVAKTILNLLKIFEGKVTFNFNNLTFVNLASPSGIEMPLSKLPGSRIAKDMFPDRNDVWIASLTQEIATLYNKKRDREGFLNEELPFAFNLVLMALVYRLNHEELDVRKAVNSIIGTYAIPKHSGFELVLSDDPVLIFAKSTGQTWEERSCEKYKTSPLGRKKYGPGGSYGNGVYYDIMFSNIVAFVKDSDGNFVSRIMIRRCIDERGKVKFGIESKWYSGTNERTDVNSPYGIAKGLSAQFATDFIAKILTDKGYYDYETCITPYKYKGYSDVKEGPGEIKYKRRSIDF